MLTAWSLCMGAGLNTVVISLRMVHKLFCGNQFDQLHTLQISSLPKSQWDDVMFLSFTFCYLMSSYLIWHIPHLISVYLLRFLLP